ncbi:hypothetical protein, partial [Mesorhizobium sp.]|uniref:hypothetical protein n=1 Tax=Mesorhizobium sp. TaxID=1871066 RepID=UPI002579BE0A
LIARSEIKLSLVSAAPDSSPVAISSVIERPLLRIRSSGGITPADAANPLDCTVLTRAHHND